MAWEKLREYFFKSDGGISQSKFRRNVLILLGIGVFLMLFNYVFTGTERERPEETLEESDIKSYEPKDAQEKELISKVTSLLNQVDGVNEVSIYLTKESGPEKELAYDLDEHKTTTTEEDAEGGIRETKDKTVQDNPIILRDSQGGEKPLVLVEHQESYRGVLVVAEGVQDSKRKTQVVEALQSLLGLPAHRITVLPRGG